LKGIFEAPTHNNKAYHIDLSPHDIEGIDIIFVVGDPSRTSIFEKFFSKVIFRKEKREFVSLAGIFNGKKILCISTGIGTDNIEIVISELKIISSKPLKVIRLGTSGIIQPDIEPGSFIYSRYAIGLDNLPFFYERHNMYFDPVLTSLSNKMGFPVDSYGVSAQIVKDIPGVVSGITITAPGFYAPQKRDVLVSSLMPPLSSLSNFSYNNLRITNFEMECSFLYFICSVAGFSSATYCVGIFNRLTGKGITDYTPYVETLTGILLEYLP